MGCDPSAFASIDDEHPTAQGPTGGFTMRASGRLLVPIVVPLAAPAAVTCLWD
jgi:hypothetical protein